MAFSSVNSSKYLKWPCIFEVDSDSIIEELNCTKCGRLMIDAYQTYCGCQYCRECILKYLTDGNEYCDGGKNECKDELLLFDCNVVLSPMLNRRILKARVHCPNKPCIHITEVTRMEEHMRECNHQSMRCPFSMIGCEIDDAPKDRMLAHIRDDTLTHSQLLITFIDNLRNEFSTVKEQLEMSKSERPHTPLEPFLAPKLPKINESDIVKRMDKQDQRINKLEQEKDREKSMLQLEFETLELKSKGLQTCLSDHLNKMKDEHEMSKLEILALCEKLREKDVQIDDIKSEMRTQNVRVHEIKELQEQNSNISKLKRQIENLKTENNELKKDIENLKVESTQREKEFATLKKEMEEVREYSRNIKNTVETSERESTKYRDETRSTLTKMKEETDKKENNKADSKKTSILPRNIRNSMSRSKSDAKLKLAELHEKEDVHRNVVSFTVDGYDSKMTAGEEILSPYFYSHTNGYKLRLSVHPGGRGDSKGVYLSAFFVICKGKYDDLLQWPCRHTFTIGITNQNDGATHESQTFSYVTAKSEHQNSFDKPINKDNPGLGSPKLISHEDLQSVKGLLKEDAVIVRCAMSSPM